MFTHFSRAAQRVCDRSAADVVLERFDSSSDLTCSSSVAVPMAVDKANCVDVWSLSSVNARIPIVVSRVVRKLGKQNADHLTFEEKENLNELFR